jgi:hypothetical protein
LIAATDVRISHTFDMDRSIGYFAGAIYGIGLGPLDGASTLRVCATYCVIALVPALNEKWLIPFRHDIPRLGRLEWLPSQHAASADQTPVRGFPRLFLGKSSRIA